MSAFWRWSFSPCVLKCTVLLLGNYARWVCHKMWFFLWECCTSSWKKALRCQLGFDSIHKTLQQIRFPCRRNCVTAVLSVGPLKRSANKGGTHCHQHSTKPWYHLTFSAPHPFLFSTLLIVPTLKAGTQKRLSGQEAVSAPHAQAQGAHTEVLRLLRLHRKVGESIRASLGFRLPAQVHILKWFFFFSSHRGGWPPTTSWPRVTRVSSVTSASKCCTTTPRATRWENSWPTLT